MPGPGTPHRSRLILALALPLAASIALTLGGCPLFGDGGNDNTNDNGNANDNGTPTTGDSGLTGKYVGSARCSLCHNNTHSKWSQTLHAGALEALEDIGEDTNADCLGCHTVGWGQEGGFKDRATTNSLAGVGCEACHGPGGDHVNNIEDDSLRPPKNIAASVCGACHTGEHQPNYDDWLLSRHAQIQELLVEEFIEGTNANTCGQCHSGDVFVAKVNGETVGADFLAGKAPEDLNPITCAVCHDPHQRTGNAATPEDGRDYQLRFAQIKYTTPTNTIAAATDPSRFNLCGQCHHARDRVWTATSREPHPSDQVNVFFGEMPLPGDKPDPIIPSRPSVHLNTAEQCSTCHVFRTPATGVSPTISGHTFVVNFEGCVECHGTAEIAQAKLEGLKIELDFRVKLVKDALDAWALDNDIDGKGVLSWEYTSEGGPASSGQSKIPDGIKKARFIYYYVVSGGGNGVHNPDYVREGLILALEYVNTAGPRLP
jgi:hypothetical protein